MLEVGDSERGIKHCKMQCSTENEQMVSNCAVGWKRIHWVDADVLSGRIRYRRRRGRRKGSRRARGRSLCKDSSAIPSRGWQGEEHSHAMTRPPNLPTPSTLPQSLPSTLTTLHASSPSLSFILVLACPLTPSSPPSTCSGSNSGFVSPSHLLSIFKLGVSTPTLSTP